MATDFSEYEMQDGVRMTWNVWPNSKVEATKCVVPYSVLYTPNKPLPQMPVLPYEPVRCKTCRSVLNPYARVDFLGKLWICPFCFQRNAFPPHYAGVSETNLPAELFPQYTTVEYTLTSTLHHPTLPLQQQVQQASAHVATPSPSLPTSPFCPVFLFVLDICVIEEELAFMKAAVAQALSLLPENALVGLITFGSQVHVHELGFTECPKMFVFRGSGKELSRAQIAEQLGLSLSGGGGAMTGGAAIGGGGGQRGAGGAAATGGTFHPETSRFLLAASECEFSLSSVLDELHRDSFPVPAGSRSARCSGTALSVAVGLLGCCVSGYPARILTLLGGPCTEGQGMIVGKDLSEPIRSHKDLEKDSAPHHSRALKLYEAMAKTLTTQGHVFDLFASAVDQVGIAEMKVAVEATGGLVVLAESFGHQVFKDSFKRVFDASSGAARGGVGGGGEGQGVTQLQLAYNGILEVHCSKDIKIQGIIGPCSSLERRGPQTSDAPIGEGMTSAWKMCGLDSSTTLAVFFEICSSSSASASASSNQGMIGNPGNAQAQQQFFLQFTTGYQHPNGETRFRVSTITRRWIDGSMENSLPDLMSGFDQEAAAVVISRLTSLKMESEDEFDATRWLDRLLIRLCNKFGDYRKDDPASFSLAPNFSIFPQFMFNLRRSQYVQVFGNSPDETAYFRMVLNRESVLNCLVMVQPSLLSYSFSAPPEPALLDVAAIAADRILLLDSFFFVVVFHGTTIAQWRNAGYHTQPEHVAFAQLLQQPQEDASAIIRERFPVPRLVDCDHHGSQSRFLLAKLNPSSTYNSATAPPPGGDVINTDDVSLQVFMEHLQRLAVQS